MLADVSGDEQYVWRRAKLTTAYVVHALSRFFDERTLTSFVWPSDMLCASAMDGFLFGLRTEFRERLVNRWGVEHKCALCDECFLLGVDGKHGARRFTCAWRDIGLDSVPSLGGIGVRQPCLNRAVEGSIFCGEHCGATGVDEEVAEGDVEAASKVIILSVRKGSQKVAPLTRDACEPEYEVSITGADGDVTTAWLKTFQISPTLLAEFEDSAASARGARANETK